MSFLSHSLFSRQSSERRPRAWNGRDLAVFGGRSGAGLAIARAAAAAGWRVSAIVRPGADTTALATCRCRVIEACASEPRALTAALARLPRGAALVSTLGGRQGRVFIDEVANRVLIDAAVQRQCARLVLVSSLGAGDSRAHASPRLLDAIGDVLLAKTRVEQHLRAFGPPHVIVRPGALTDGPATGTGQLTPAADAHGGISRAELARLVLDAVATPALDGQTLAAIDPAATAGGYTPR